MKTSEIAAKFGLRKSYLDEIIRANEIEHTIDLFGDTSIKDDVVDFLLELYYEKLDSLKKSPSNEQVQFDNMILTSASQIDGMRITKQLGLCFGEVILKSSFLDSLSASFDNFFSSLSFSATEMTGSMELLEKARNYAIMRMKKEAFAKGANAIIAIDAETTYGFNSIMHISIYGTAVKVEKIDGI